MSNQKQTCRNELIYQMRNEGMVYRQIGEHFGISGPRARWIYEKLARKIRTQNDRRAQQQ
jgi:hypothetical protein